MTKVKDKIKKPKKEDLDKYWVNDGPKTVFFILWILANAACFGERFYYYYKGDGAQYYAVLGHGVTMARGAGAALKLNCSIILVTVCRNILTKIRSTKIGGLLPIDHNIEFHKGIAWTILFWTLVHCVAHFFNFHNLENYTGTVLTQAPAYKTSFLSIPGGTGHVATIVMLLMYTSAVSRVRRPMFEVFWYTHHLFIVFYAMLIFHGFASILEKPSFWYWFIVPGLLYIIERILRVVRGKQDTILKMAVAHPSKVLEMQMQKTSFNYKPGQYLFLACPFLASHEWHPFTITSCPDEDFVSVHIRIVGDWTGALWSMMNPENTLGVVQENKTTADDGTPILKIDGPFGAASEEVFNFETVLLCGAGIGVTPFASILKACRYSIERQLSGQSGAPLRKAYFYWISRDRSAFEWFSELLGALESENINNFLEIKTYLTGALRPDEIRNVMYGDDEADAITGLEARTQFGRPNWKEEFAELSRLHPGSTVGVFFCGPAVLSKDLMINSKRFTKETTTKFVFHKENF